jgi:hypothetical protein
MEQYLNDTLTTESKLKADNLSQVDLMPQAIKNWYVQHNKSAYLTPIEYNNDELSDVWDMEMLAEGVVKTKTKDTTPAAPVPLPTSDKTNKDSLLPNTDKKKRLKP